MDIKDVIYRISKLTNKEQQHILDILKANRIEYTKNSNGYFFNFLKINNIVIDKMIKCLELIEKNRGLVKEMDKRRNELITYYKRVIEERLRLSFAKRHSENIKRLAIKVYKTNIELNIKRVTKIKKINKFYAKDSGEVDFMLKEYIKSKTKFPKDSVYFRIFSNMKSNKRGDTKSDKDNNYDYKSDANEKAEANIIVEDNLDEDNVEEDIVDDDDVDDIDDDNVDDDDENKTDQLDSFSDEYNLTDDAQLENDINTEDSETIKPKTKSLLGDDKTELEIKYYKNLLNQQGFLFDENKRCFLIKQPYLT